MKKQQLDKERMEQQRIHVTMMNKSREAQRRMIKISTYQEFEMKMLDTTNKKKRIYKTHVLLMFVGNKQAEKRGHEELYFPHPFTDTNNNILQVARIRYNTDTALTRLFNVPTRKRNNDDPHVVFARKGDNVDKFRVFNFNLTRNRIRKQHSMHDEFTKWVNSLLTVQVNIGNRHPLPVELFIMRNGQVIHGENLKSNYLTKLNLNIGDEIYAYDSRLDTFLTTTRVVRDERIISKMKGTLLLEATVGDSTTAGSASSSSSDNKNVYSITIQPSRCYDLSTQCHSLTRTSSSPWRKGENHEQCNINTEFFHNICPYTCGVCSNNYITSDIVYLILHRPIHTFPTRLLQRFVRSGRFVLQRSINFGTYFIDDVRNIKKLRKNTALVFFALGLLIAFNYLLFKTSIDVSTMRSEVVVKLQQQAGQQPITNMDESLSDATLIESIIMLLSVQICIGMKCLMAFSRFDLPFWLQRFHRDLTSVSSRHTDVFIMLLCIGIGGGGYFRCVFSSFANDTLDTDMAVVYMTALLSILSAKSAVLSYVIDSNPLFRLQLKQIWEYNKDAAFAIILVGACVGIGLISLWRLSINLRKRISLSLILSNLIVLAVVVGVVSMDPHFISDLMHVIDMRKNAAFGFVVLGVLSGHFIVELGNFIYETLTAEGEKPATIGNEENDGLQRHREAPSPQFHQLQHINKVKTC